MKPALSSRAARGSFRAIYGDTHDSKGDTESSTRGTSTKKNRRDKNKNKNKNKDLEDKKSSTSKRVSISVNPRVLDCSTPQSSSKRPFLTIGRVCHGCGGNH
jgi:hypothetical protein